MIQFRQRFRTFPLACFGLSKGNPCPKESRNEKKTGMLGLFFSQKISFDFPEIQLNFKNLIGAHGLTEYRLEVRAEINVSTHTRISIQSN